MKPSERIHEIASRDGVDMGEGTKAYNVHPRHILEYLDEQAEQSSHAAKGEPFCDDCTLGVGPCPRHSELDAAAALAKAEQHGGGRAVTTADGTTHTADPNASTHGGPLMIDSEKWKSPAPDGDGGEEDGRLPPFTVDGQKYEPAVFFGEQACGPMYHDQLMALVRVLRPMQIIAVSAACAEALGLGGHLLGNPWKLKLEESAEALGRAEAALKTMTELHKSAMESVELCTRERQDETARAEKAEAERGEAMRKLELDERVSGTLAARVRAWEPVVRAAIVYCGPQLESFEAAHAEASALEAAVEALPAEHRPEPAKTGGSGG